MIEMYVGGVFDAGYMLAETRYPKSEIKTIAENPIPFIVSITIIAGAVVTILVSDLRIQMKWFLMTILVLAAGTREMMGFSPTMYVSGRRTFTFLMFTMMWGIIVLGHELLQYDIPKRIKGFWSSIKDK